MNNLQEKIEIIRAMDKGLTIQYSETDGEEDDWEDLETGELDFGMYEYRIKPNDNPDARFQIGDKLVDRRVEGQDSPLRFELTSIDDKMAKLDGCWDVPLDELYKHYTFVNDVLWYFETYDFSASTWRMITDRRFAICDISDKFKYDYDRGTLRPLYALGFALSKKR